MPEYTIGLNEDGDLTFVYADEISFLQDLGEFSVRRASHVEPTEDGKWTASMVDGPVLGPFDLRGEALSAEVSYLQSTLFQ